MIKKIQKKNYKNHPEIYAVYYCEDHKIYLNSAYEEGRAGCEIILIKPIKEKEVEKE